MDQKSFVRRVEAGEFLAIGEYRHSKAEMIKWRDKQTGKPMEAPVCRHTVEFGDLSVAVSENVPDGTKLEDIKIPFVKGERVILRLEQLTRNMGAVSARGVLEKVAPSPASGPAVGGASNPGSKA